MKGFKDTTRTHCVTGGKPGTKGAAKIATVLSEFKRGDLRSGSKDGPKVRSRDQAVAIALSESRRRGKS